MSGARFARGSVGMSMCRVPCTRSRSRMPALEASMAKAARSRNAAWEAAAARSAVTYTGPVEPGDLRGLERRIDGGGYCASAAAN